MQEKDTPFHRGELILQEKMGVRDQVHSYAPRMIRSYMPDQHRAFFSSLSYFFMGGLDKSGAPWASVVWGEPGFVSTPTADSLEVSAKPNSGDPLYEVLRQGAELGMVGLMFENRRRNRVNGQLVDAGPDSMQIKVTQSFGNCPQYIQTRQGTIRPATGHPDELPRTSSQLNGPQRRLIETSDTLFIASASEALGLDARHGADISHRGGAPGFVKILEDGSLLIPDFSGNRHFNTLGNILETGKAGLLFIDFERGDLLQMTGTASIVWPKDCPYEYDGAERYIQIRPTKIVKRTGAFPFRWTFLEPSPYLPVGASWRRTATNKHRYRLADKVQETDDIASFYLVPED